MTVLKRILSQVPTPICGLALGISSLGWCWEYASFMGEHALDGKGQLFGAIAAAILLLAVGCKFILQPALLKQDLKHPVTGGLLPTFSMALMIISNSIGKFNILLGDTIWLTALFLHILLLIAFVYHRRRFELNHMIPSWFVPPVGMIVADVSFSGSPLLAPIAHGVLMFGISAYSVLLPLMIYRFIFCQNISDDAKPTIAILAAPGSLCLTGYLSVTEQPSLIVVALLASIALLMTLVVYLVLLRLLRLPFSFDFSAFTFPLVIGASALSKTAHWMGAINVKHHYVAQVMDLAYFELVVATVMVSYVALRYLWHGIVNLATAAKNMV